MADFVVDASVALAWCFEDEAGADALLDRLQHGDRTAVPAHWPTEILNGLLTAARRKRIEPDQPLLLWDQLARLPIEIEPTLSQPQARAVAALGAKHVLTAYDAAYLELARRGGIPLGTLDTEQRKAAQAEGVILL